MHEPMDSVIELMNEAFSNIDDSCTEEELNEAVEGYATGDLTAAQLAGITVEELYWMATKGYELMEHGQLDAARMIFQGLIQANPYDATFHAILGSVAQKQRKVEEAITHYGRAAELNPDDVYSVMNAGELKVGRSDKLFSDGDTSGAARMLEEGLRDLRRVLELDPGLKSSPGVRARLLLEILSQQVASN